MKQFGVIIWLLLITPISGYAYSIDGYSNGVEIQVEDLIDDAGHKYGVEFYSFNHNTYSVYLSIWLIGGHNILDGLRKGQILIYPFDRVYLGWVMQDDISKSWRYSYRWSFYAPGSSQHDVSHWYWY